MSLALASQPREADDLRNAHLDAFEANVRAMLANGFEPQLRARLARLLPERKPAAMTAAEAIEIDLQSASIVAACRRAQQLRLSESDRAVFARLKTWALNRLTQSTPATGEQP